MPIPKWLMFAVYDCLRKTAPLRSKINDSLPSKSEIMHHAPQKKPVQWHHAGAFGRTGRLARRSDKNAGAHFAQLKLARRVSTIGYECTQHDHTIATTETNYKSQTFIFCNRKHKCNLRLWMLRFASSPQPTSYKCLFTLNEGRSIFHAFNNFFKHFLRTYRHSCVFKTQLGKIRGSFIPPHFFI